LLVKGLGVRRKKRVQAESRPFFLGERCAFV
jgi:hypothetical protein